MRPTKLPKAPNATARDSSIVRAVEGTSTYGPAGTITRTGKHSRTEAALLQWLRPIICLRRSSLDHLHRRRPATPSPVLPGREPVLIGSLQLAMLPCVPECRSDNRTADEFHAIGGRRRSIVNRLIAAWLLPGLAYSTVAVAAPPQLLNKTIISSFTVTVPAIEADGKHIVARRTSDRRIYISSAGRIFEKRVQSGKINRKESEIEPADTRLHFVGPVLRAYLPRLSGVTLIEYTFDSSFRTCDVAVISGTSDGSARRWRALNGKIRTAAGEHCVQRKLFDCRG